MVEHAAVNRVVVGSSPTSGANFASRWWTTTAAGGNASNRCKCVVKRVVTVDGDIISPLFTEDSVAIRPLSFNQLGSKTPMLKGVYENKILVVPARRKFF